MIKESEKERIELNTQLQKQAEGLEEMKKQKEYAERQVEVLTTNLNEAQKEATRAVTELTKMAYLQREDVDLTEEVYRRDAKIQELEEEREDHIKKIAGLKKLSNVVEQTMKENTALKDKLQVLENQNVEVTHQMKKFEDTLKTTSRRLSKSQEDKLDLNDTVSSEMFRENSDNSPPFHGFSSGSGGDQEMEVSNLIDKVPKSILKRAHSNPGEVTDVSKRKNRHPTIGSKILVDTANDSGVFQVISKKTQSSEEDYV